MSVHQIGKEEANHFDEIKLKKERNEQWKEWKNEARHVASINEVCGIVYFLRTSLSLWLLLLLSSSFLNKKKFYLIANTNRNERKKIHGKKSWASSKQSANFRSKEKERKKRAHQCSMPSKISWSNFRFHMRVFRIVGFLSVGSWMFFEWIKKSQTEKMENKMAIAVDKENRSDTTLVRIQ